MNKVNLDFVEKLGQPLGYIQLKGRDPLDARYFKLCILDKDKSKKIFMRY